MSRPVGAMGAGARGRAYSTLVRGCQEALPGFFDKKAVVVAPHPDDETLGCGGTIALKVAAGAEVTVIFMTDGSASHAHLMPSSELAALRHGEALAACARLGIKSSQVHFLDFPDGQLGQYTEEAVAAVGHLMESSCPSQVFLPHQGEELSDHVATYWIAHRACETAVPSAVAFEYGVWLWDQWPWTNPLSAPMRRQRPRQALRRAANSQLGFRMARLLNTRVQIESVLEIKRAALAEHRTQLTRIEDAAEWTTLGDIDGGRWLRNLTGPNEFFRMIEPARVR